MTVLDEGKHLVQLVDFLNFLVNLVMHKLVTAKWRAQEFDARILYPWNTMTKRNKVS